MEAIGKKSSFSNIWLGNSEACSACFLSRLRAPFTGFPVFPVSPPHPLTWNRPSSCLRVCFDRNKTIITCDTAIKELEYWRIAEERGFGGELVSSGRATFTPMVGRWSPPGSTCCIWSELGAKSGLAASLLRDDKEQEPAFLKTTLTRRLCAQLTLLR